LNNLAIMMDKQGRFHEAVPMFQTCLEMYARTVGTMEPDYYNTLNSLAVCKRNLGEYEGSLEHFQKCF
jgi:tetratricopeptide (TPR) repeat protein